jgi:hypothetical protein
MADDFLSLRDERAAAFKQDDDARRYCAECAERQARRDQLVRKSAGDLVHKVHDNPLPARDLEFSHDGKTYEADTVTTDELLNDVVEAIERGNDEMAMMDARARKQARKIAKLTKEVDRLAAIVDGNVKPLRGTNVA